MQTTGNTAPFVAPVVYGGKPSKKKKIVPKNRKKNKGAK